MAGKELIGIALVVVFAVSAQLLASLLRIPAILIRLLSIGVLIAWVSGTTAAQVMPLFVVGRRRDVSPVTVEQPPRLRPGDAVIGLVPA